MTNEHELAKVIYFMIISIFVSGIGLIVCFISAITNNNVMMVFGVGWGITPLISSMIYFIYKYTKGDIR
jgi:hypothetical protein